MTSPQPEDSKNKNNFNRKPKVPQMPKFNLNWIYAVVVVVFIALTFLPKNVAIKTTKMEFISKMLMAHDVEKVVIVNKTNAEIYLKKEVLKNEKYKELSSRSILGEDVGPQYYFEIGDVSSFETDMRERQKDFPINEQISIEYVTQNNYFGDFLFTWLLPIMVLIAIYMFIMKRMSGGPTGGGQIFNIGKSRAQLFDKDTQVKITFKDVAGLDEAKVEVMEIVDFLKNPKKYTNLGGKIPKGALLVGPPGTGKTLLAKAVAGEAGVPFFSLSGSDFVEMFVGVGASRVRDLFKQAKEKSPAIIFIDEIDAVGRARGKNSMSGGNDERENTLNQLLTEMDGFGTNTHVIVIAATNRADVLDKALMRAGRFDRQIYVDLPDIRERKEIFEVHLAPLKKVEGLDTDFLAKQTPGFSGADIANVCNEAALIAARHNKSAVDKQDFLDAVDRIVGGLEKKNKIITVEEKKTIAFHEAGHATISWMLEHASPLVKVTIVPRGQSLGAAWYLPEERSITTTEQLLDQMCSALGGRASEELMFGKISTGALSDLEKVTKQAYAMVTIYGLNKKIGNISFYDSQGRDTFTKPYSEETAKIIDQEVSNLIETQYQRALALLTENKDHLISLAEKLLTEEVIFKEDLESIFGKRPWDPLIDLHNDSVRPVVETVENEAQENSVEETPEATEPEESTKSEEETGPDSNKD